MTVRDARSDHAEQSITVFVNDTDDLTPPTITIDEPGDGDAFAPEDVITFRATVDDAEDPLDTLELTMESDRDGPIEVAMMPDSEGKWSQNVEGLSGGVHLITFKVYDSHEMVGTASINVSINGLPSSPVVSISPNPAPSGEPLVVNIDEPGIDPGRRCHSAYQWYRDELIVDGAITPGIEAGITQQGILARRGHAYRWRGRGRPGYCGYHHRQPRAAGRRSADHSRQSKDHGRPVGDPEWLFDQDGDLPLYDFIWTLNGDVDTDEVSDTFPREKTQRGDELRVSVVPKDAFASGEAVLSSLIVIENTAPTGGGVVVTPGAPEPTDDLLCTVDVIPTDDDGDPIEYTYRWLVDGVEDPGLTGPVVDSLETSNLETWTCEVTPTDGMRRVPRSRLGVRFRW